MRLIVILCVLSTALAIVGSNIPGAIGYVMLYVSGLIAGAMLLIVAGAYREQKREHTANHDQNGA